MLPQLLQRSLQQNNLRPPLGEFAIQDFPSLRMRAVELRFDDTDLFPQRFLGRLPSCARWGDESVGDGEGYGHLKTPPDSPTTDHSRCGLGRLLRRP